MRTDALLQMGLVAWASLVTPAIARPKGDSEPCRGLDPIGPSGSTPPGFLCDPKSQEEQFLYCLFERHRSQKRCDRVLLIEHSRPAAEYRKRIPRLYELLMTLPERYRATLVKRLLVVTIDLLGRSDSPEHELARWDIDARTAANPKMPWSVRRDAWRYGLLPNREPVHPCPGDVNDPIREPGPLTPEELAEFHDPLARNGGFGKLSRREREKLLRMGSEFGDYVTIREVFLRPEITPEPGLRAKALALFDEILRRPVCLVQTSFVDFSVSFVDCMYRRPECVRQRIIVGNTTIDIWPSDPRPGPKPVSGGTPRREDPPSGFPYPNRLDLLDLLGHALDEAETESSPRVSPPRTAPPPAPAGRR